MPEGGLQQLFIVVLFVVFGLIDLFGRWAKGRRQEREPFTEQPTWRPIDAPPPIEVPAPAKPRVSSQSSDRSAPQRPTATVAATPRPATTARIATAPAPTVQRRSSVIDVREARRAVIAATVLGPCLAMRDVRATDAVTRAPALD